MFEFDEPPDTYAPSRRLGYNLARPGPIQSQLDAYVRDTKQSYNPFHAAALMRMQWMLNNPVQDDPKQDAELIRALKRRRVENYKKFQAAARLEAKQSREQAFASRYQKTQQEALSIQEGEDSDPVFLADYARNSLSAQVTRELRPWEEHRRVRLAELQEAERIERQVMTWQEIDPDSLR